MRHLTTRRDFFRDCASVGLAASGLGMLRGMTVGAGEPIRRPGYSRLSLSLAAYSFRDYFKDSAHQRDKETDTSRRIDMLQFIDYCADHDCAGAELTSYYFPKEVTSDFLIRLRRHAFLRGIAISGTAVGNDFTVPKGELRNREIAAAKAWIDRAAVLGAPHIRIFAGSAKGVSKADAKSLCISAIEECADYAGTKGIFLGIENHGGIVAEAQDLLDIVRAVKSRWLGVNLDTGNFITDDPYADLATIAPYAVNVQFKVEMRKRGQTKNEPADYARVIKILHEANYQGYVALEYEAAEDPWKAVPQALQKLKAALAA